MLLYKSMTLLVLVALAVCVFAINDIVQEDQAAADEQSYRIHQKPETWRYQYGVNAFPLFARFSRPSPSPPTANYLRLNADRVDYSAASYPSDFFVGIRNVAYPYRAYPYDLTRMPPPGSGILTVVKNVAYPYPGYGYGFNTYPYGTYGAVPYVAAAPAAAPAKA